MKPLHKIYKPYLSDESISRWIKIRNAFTLVFCSMILFVAFISSLVFCIRSYSSDLAILGVCQLVGALTGLYALVTAHVKRRDIKKMFNNFQTFYTASKF